MTLEQTRELVLGVLKEFDSPVLESGKIRVETDGEHTCTLCFPNKFLLDYFRGFHLAPFTEKVHALSGTTLIIRLDHAKNKLPELEPFRWQGRPELPDPLPAFVPAPVPYTRTIRPEFTFENFAVGESNEIACGATQSLVEWHLTHDSSGEPIPEHRALLITGNVGFGKTHLLHACANAIRDFPSEVLPVYVPSEAFTNHFVRVIRSGDTKQIHEFRAKYRETPLLLLDDIHFLAGKPKTEEELIATIDALINNGSLIIFTAVQRLTSLPFRKELLSRLSAFTPVEIGPPDLALRIAIIQKKAERSGMPLANELATFIAERTGEDMRSIEGVIKRLKVSHQFGSREINIALLSEWLGESPLKMERLSIASIKQGVAEYFEVSVSDLMHGGRRQPIATARQVAMYLCVILLQKSASEIGRAFDKDHTTVLAAISAVEKKLEQDEHIQKAVGTMTALLTAKT